MFQVLHFIVYYPMFVSISSLFNLIYTVTVNLLTVYLGCLLATMIVLMCSCMLNDLWMLYLCTILESDWMLISLVCIIPIARISLNAYLLSEYWILNILSYWELSWAYLYLHSNLIHTSYPLMSCHVLSWKSSLYRVNVWMFISGC